MCFIILKAPHRLCQRYSNFYDLFRLIIKNENAYVFSYVPKMSSYICQHIEIYFQKTRITLKQARFFKIPQMFFRLLKTTTTI